MKKFYGLTALFIALCLTSLSVSAKGCPVKGCDKAKDAEKIEAYAHPTLFGSSAQETVGTDEVYVIGGKMLKAKNQINVKGKDNVLVESWVKDILATLRENTDQKVFNPKMPVLRSELAVILAEGLCLKDTDSSYVKYSDISSKYWAKKWIANATNAKIMIGYPDNTFRPDQPVTKAEVFATIATLIDVPIDRSLIIPAYKGNEMKFIPRWAVSPTKEVLASQLLNELPCPDKAAGSEYLSKEQVAYLVGTLRQQYIYKYVNSKAGVKLSKYTPTCIAIKLDERLSAKVSNIGDKFTAKTTKAVTIGDICFDADSTVKGEVIEVNRPGVKNPGYIKVRFTEIKNGEKCLKFPKNISEAQAAKIKNPNFVARLFGAPFSASARVIGVTGRTAGSIVNVTGNGVEKFGDNWSNAFVDTFSMHPGEGVKNVGASFVTVGKGILDLSKLLVSGVFGIVYELGDEIVYLIVPNCSNNSSLNPGEELVIVY